MQWLLYLLTARKLWYKMFELKRLNVHRIVETEHEKAKLIAEGFEEVIVKVKKIVEVKKGKA